MQRAAKALLRADFPDALREELAKGLSFAAARESAARALIGEDAAVLREPNDILGVEYCKALLQSGSTIAPLAILRKVVGHNGGAAKGFASASHIRELLINGACADEFLTPESAAICARERAAGRAPVTMANAERAILARLRAMREEDFAPFDGGGEGLYHRFYDAVPDMVAEAMREISKITGREYKPFVYYGAADAENIVIAMGSVTETLRETVDYLNARGGKVGVVTVHLYRPFSVKYLGEVLPETVKRICVLDRTKEPGANGDPLYLDVVEAFANCKDIPADRKPLIIGGRYGLSSKDTTPAQMLAVFANLGANEPKNQFTVGIVDDVTFRSLPVGEEISLAKPGTFEALFFGLGADGTVGANKNSIKIIGGTTNKYCQAYFSYDSKKSGGYTSSPLRFGALPITSP